MRAVVVVVLPELPEDADGEPARIQAFSAVMDALVKIDPMPPEMIACVSESAEAVIRAAGCEGPFPHVPVFVPPEPPISTRYRLDGGTPAKRAS
jgi:hypothetical protein